MRFKIYNRNKNYHGIVSNEKEGERTADGVDRAQAGSRYRKELDFVHRLLLFPWFSSFGVIKRDQS